MAEFSVSISQGGDRCVVLASDNGTTPAPAQAILVQGGRPFKVLGKRQLQQSHAEAYALTLAMGVHEFAVCNSEGGRIWVCSLEDAQLLFVCKGLAPAFSPDGRHLALLQRRDHGPQEGVVICRTDTRKVMATWRCHDALQLHDGGGLWNADHDHSGQYALTWQASGELHLRSTVRDVIKRDQDIIEEPLTIFWAVLSFQ